MAARSPTVPPPFADCVVAHAPLSDAGWALVPVPCPGLGAVLPSVLQGSSEQAARLAEHVRHQRLRAGSPAVWEGRAPMCRRAVPGARPAPLASAPAAAADVARARPVPVSLSRLGLPRSFLCCSAFDLGAPPLCTVLWHVVQGLRGTSYAQIHRKGLVPVVHPHRSSLAARREGNRAVLKLHAVRIDERRPSPPIAAPLQPGPLPVTSPRRLSSIPPTSYQPQSRVSTRRGAPVRALAPLFATPHRRPERWRTRLSLAMQCHRPLLN